MSDFSYRIIRAIGFPAFWVSSSPVVLHGENLPKTGAAILAPTHLSHYDVPCLIAVCRRNIDFMSVVEFLKKPWVARLFRSMNCFFLDRGKSDPAAVREGLRRLQAGRLIAMFPEGHIRALEGSAAVGKPFKPGVAKLAVLSGATVIPCVVLNTIAYQRFTAWLPLKRTRFGVAFGTPILAPADVSADDAQRQITHQLAEAYIRLYQELSVAMGNNAPRS